MSVQFVLKKKKKNAVRNLLVRIRINFSQQYLFSYVVQVTLMSLVFFFFFFFFGGGGGGGLVFFNVVVVVVVVGFFFTLLK